MRKIVKMLRASFMLSAFVTISACFAQSSSSSDSKFPASGSFKPNSAQPDIEWGYGQTIFEKNSEKSAWDALTSRAGFFQELVKRYPSINFRKGKETSNNEYVYLCDGTIQFSYVAPLAMHIIQIHGKKNNFLVVVGLEKDGAAYTAGIKVWDQILSVNKRPFTKAVDGSYNTNEGVFMEFANFVDKAQAKGGALLEVRRYIEPKFRMKEKVYGKVAQYVVPKDEYVLKTPYEERLSSLPKKLKSQLNLADAKFYRKASIPVKIKKEGAFSKFFPHKCRKSQTLKKIVVKELIDASEKRRLTTGNSIGVAGLALLANVDTSSDGIEALENYVINLIPDAGDRNNFIDGKTNYIANSSIGGSWGNGMNLIFLCEYFHATKDMRVFPILQKLAFDASFKHLNPFGGGGHGIGGRGSYFDYSFGAPSALNTLAAALSKKVGAKVNEQMWQKYYDCYSNRIDRVIKATKRSGKAVDAKDSKYDFKYNPKRFYGAHYMARMNESEKPGFWEQAFTSATAGMALYHMPKTGYSKELGDNIISHVKMKPFQHSYIHASPLLGLFWCHMAAAMPEYVQGKKKGSKKLVPNALNKGLRASLEHRKAHILFTTTDNHRYFYPYPKRTRFSDMGGGAVGGGWGGDSYLNMKGITLSCTAMFLSADKRVLLLHDNSRGGYMVPKKKINIKDQVRAYHSFYLTERLKALTTEPKNNPEAINKVYVEAKFLLDNYKDVPGHKKVKNFLNSLYKKFGRKRVEQYAIKFDCIEHVDYVIKSHERANRKDKEGNPGGVQGNRKGWLLYVASKFKHHPIHKEVEKLANRADIKTLDVDAELNKLIGRKKYSSDGGSN